MSFTLRLTLAVLIAALAAAAATPLAAALIAAAGFRFPLARIFDRTVMVMFALVLLWSGRRLKLPELLRTGFADARANLAVATAGLLATLVATGILWATALAIGGLPPASLGELALHVPGWLLSALVIALIEEAFFRAIVLGGMVEGFGARGALELSAAVYALAHVLRSPGRSYAAGLEPLAGFHILLASLGALAHPIAVLPALVGLFLLGLVLGEAFLLTGRVYFGVGLHAGLVFAAKTWRMAAPASDLLPRWLVGYARPPLISGAAAWVVALMLLIVIRPLARWAAPSPQS